LEAVHLPANPGDGASITLESMSDIVGVNQLAPRQTLVFETGGLTVIYGQNGAGEVAYCYIVKISWVKYVYRSHLRSKEKP
jgi:hypothetical protein